MINDFNYLTQHGIECHSAKILVRIVFIELVLRTECIQKCFLITDVEVKFVEKLRSQKICLFISLSMKRLFSSSGLGFLIETSGKRNVSFRERESFSLGSLVSFKLIPLSM